jgi:hypothetical protein
MKRRNLPPHHPEAMTWHDAYQLQELMPQAAWNALDTAPFVAAALDPDKADSLAEKVGGRERRLARPRPPPSAAIRPATLTAGAQLLWDSWGSCGVPSKVHVQERRCRILPPQYCELLAALLLSPPVGVLLLQNARPPADAGLRGSRQQRCQLHAVRVVQVPAYVVSRLGILAAEADSSELQRRATCLAYLAALLQLHGQPPWVRTKGLAYGLGDEARKRGMRRELLEALMDRFFIQMPQQGWVTRRAPTLQAGCSHEVPLAAGWVCHLGGLMSAGWAGTSFG